METIISAVEKFITSRNEGIDLALVVALAILGNLAGLVSSLFFIPLVVLVVAFLLRGHAQDKANRNAEAEAERAKWAQVYSMG